MNAFEWSFEALPHLWTSEGRKRSNGRSQGYRAISHTAGYGACFDTRAFPQDMGHDKTGLLHSLQRDVLTRPSTQYLFTGHAGVTNQKAYKHAFLLIEHDETFVYIYSKTCLKRNTIVLVFFSRFHRFPFYKGLCFNKTKYKKYDRLGLQWRNNLK